MPAPSPNPPHHPSATPTATPLPTFTPLPTLTPTATSFVTPTPAPCDRAALIADVSFPPGALVAPGQTLAKTWRLRNASPCTWTPGYWLVNVSGDFLGGPVSVRIPYLVFPGGEITLTVELFAPCHPGIYFNNWMLRDENGADFGVGSSYTAPLLVVIVVTGTPIKSVCSLPHGLN